jgi:hypothetical protein
MSYVTTLDIPGPAVIKGTNHRRVWAISLFGFNLELWVRQIDCFKDSKEYLLIRSFRKPTVKEAMDVLSEAIMADMTPGSYGYSWLCNIAMPLWDQRDKLDLKEPADCNKMAEILLRHFFQKRPVEQVYPEKHLPPTVP